MKQTLLVKNLIMVAIFVFAINVTSAQHENAAATKEEVTTEVKDSSVKEAQATVVDQKFDPNKFEFPADELNGGSEVATEKSSLQPESKTRRFSIFYENSNQLVSCYHHFNSVYCIIAIK